MPNQIERFTGWVPHPEETEIFAETIPEKISSAVDSLATDERKDTCVWRPYSQLIKATGKRLPARNQGSKGSCVGAADARCNTFLAAADIIERGESEELPAPISIEVSYIASRQIGNMLGGGDGSYGAAQAKANREIGVAHMVKIGQWDLTSYSIDTIEKWDRRGGGLPREVMEYAKQHPTHETPRVKELEQLDGLLHNYFPVEICSSFGSRDKETDEFGRLKWNGHWSHAMSVVGVIWRKIRGVYRRIYIIANSWGSRWLTRATLIVPDQPYGSFGMDEDDMRRVLKGGDSFGRTDHQGPRKRTLDLSFAFAS